MSPIRHPALHFLILGGLLFLAGRVRERPPAAAPARAPVVVDATRIREEFTERSGLVPTPADEDALVEQAIEEELLYREALARGFDREDRSIRHRLSEKMRFLDPEPERSADEYYRDALALGLDREDALVRRMLVEKMRLLIAAGATTEPDEPALAAYVAAHPERWAEPARVRLWQVYAGRSAAEAERILAALRAGRVAPERGAAHGAPFPLGSHVGPSSERQLARLFGVDFAHAALALPVGAWSGPVASTYGLHLVWIERRDDPAPPELSRIRGQVREAVRAEQRPERLRQALAVLRSHYDIRITGGAS